MCNGDIICITETHLKSEIGDGEININGYTAHRCDRERTKGGGTIIYTKNCVNAFKHLEWRNNQCELVGIQIRKLNTLILCLYRPPSSGSKEQFEECIDIMQLTLNENSNFKNVILCGDLNKKNID